MAEHEISADAFERELREGRPVTVLDVRHADAFEAWHLDPGTGTLRRTDEAGAEGALAGVPADAEVRVICNAGNTSGRVADALADRFPHIRSVAGGMIGWSRVLACAEIETGGPARIVQFRREARGCLSYLVESEGKALVVDPSPGIEPYLAEAARHGATVTHVFDTHVHADHLSGARELAEHTGARLHMSDRAPARGLQDAGRFATLADGDALPIGAADVRVVALPGHTSDMAGLLVDGRALIGGDSLFADSMARPDLEEGDVGAAAAARQLWATLHERVLTLPGGTLLLPCHYAGGRLAEPIAPTLDQVRAAVPELGLDADSFVRRSLANMPPRPANYLEIIDRNLGEPMDEEMASRLEVGANNCAVSPTWAAAS